MDTLLQDVRYALRALRASPGFTITAVLTLALGIGANVAIFGVSHAVLLQPLPYAHPERLVSLRETNSQQHLIAVSALDLEDWRAATRTAAHLAGYEAGDENVAGGAEPARVSTAFVTPEFFDVFGVPPLMGRLFRGATTADGVVISYGLWQRLFGASPSALARTLKVEGRVYPVAGVLSARFDYPHGTDLWVPIDLAEDQSSRSAHNYRLVGDLRLGVTVSAAQAEFSAIAARLAAVYPNSNRGVGAKVLGLQESMTGGFRPTLQLLSVMVGLVLLIATANVAGLLLARATARRREIAVRAALGAGAGRLARQLLTESVVLAGAGALAGVLLAVWAVNALRTAAPVTALPATPRVLDLPVLAFSIALALATGLLFGTAPAFAATRVDLAETLKQTGGRGATALRVRGALIGAEVTLAVLLLLGAGLTARSLWRLEGEALGFDPDHVTVADLVFQPSDSGGAWLPAYTRALNAVRAIPGVSSAAIGFGVPYGGSGSNGGFLIEGRGISADESKRPWASWAAASDSYFRTLGIPLRRGRAFERSDEDGPGVVIVSEALARTYWPGASPLGARIAVPGFDWRTFTAYRSGQNLWLTVVGVVGDVRDEALGLPPQPTLYLSLAQHPESRAMHLVVRTRLPDPALAASLAQPLRELNPDLPLRLRPMDEMVAGSAATPRLRATLIALFAALALFLASVGIYGLSAYVTAQRAVEISVRLALGASPERAARAVARRVGAWAAAGLVSGLLAGAAGARAIRAFLYGIHPADAMTFAVVGIGLGIVALAAAYLPARLAARLDPGLLARSE